MLGKVQDTLPGLALLLLGPCSVILCCHEAAFILRIARSAP